MGGGYLWALCKALHGHKLLGLELLLALFKPNCFRQQAKLYTRGSNKKLSQHSSIHFIAWFSSTHICMYGWINNEKHILHMESERYTFKLFSVCNCQSRLYSRTKLVWYFAGYLLDVEALWRSFSSGHLNQCQCSGLKVVKSLTNDCSSGNFLIGMVVIQLNLTDNPEI